MRVLVFLLTYFSFKSYLRCSFWNQYRQTICLQPCAMMHRKIQTTVFLALLLSKALPFSPRPWIADSRVSPLAYVETKEEPVAIATDTNFLTFPSRIISSKWNSLIPLIPGERGCDVTIHWTCPDEGSHRLLEHCFSSTKDIQTLQPLLYESFQKFQYLFSAKKYKARIVATRGPSGTKCPRWHIDHVPARWIQSLVGPGCDHVVGLDGINWNYVNGMETTDDINEELVDESLAQIRHAQVGEGVVLWGSENAEGKPPAVHKSPKLGPLEGRVLLTLDIVQE